MKLEEQEIFTVCGKVYDGAGADEIFIIKGTEKEIGEKLPDMITYEVYGSDNGYTGIDRLVKECAKMDGSFEEHAVFRITKNGKDLFRMTDTECYTDADELSPCAMSTCTDFEDLEEFIDSTEEYDEFVDLDCYYEDDEDQYDDEDDYDDEDEDDE